MTSGALGATSSESGGGRAFRPGPRRALAAALGLAVAAAVVAVLVLSAGHGRGAQPRASVRYGRLPSWLPHITNSAPVLELARPASPILREEQGFTVRAELPGGAADITASGPEIPAYVAADVQRGSWSDERPAPGAFIVTITNVKGTVPLRATAFSLLSDTGRIEHPAVTVKGGGPLPSALHGAQRIALLVRGSVLEGQGSIRWAPLGAKVLVGWVYQLELD